MRGQFNFKACSVHTTRKSLWISIGGVKLWNGLDEEIKLSNSITQFKERYKEIIFKRYREEEGCVTG